jgi:pimeloyl-ACP methyl ester carboxylesterase
MSDFKEGVLQGNGLSIRYAEAGEGRAVVMFPAGEGVLVDEVATALAMQHRVIVLDVPTSALSGQQNFAEQLAQALSGLGIDSFSVLGVSRGVIPALAQAVATPERVQRLILVSPSLAAVQQPELSAKLREVKAPTLVLVGTRDRSGSREAGHLCREQIPACYLVLVYDAGHAIAADRRDACLSPINDFLEQGEGFIVSHESQMIRP